MRPQQENEGRALESREQADTAHHNHRPQRHINGTTDHVQNDEMGTIRDRSVKTLIN